MTCSPFLLSFQATDLDSPDSSHVTFELLTLTNDNDPPISVDPDWGHVFLTRQLTPSDLRYFEVLVRATDDGEVQLTSNVARLVVNVISDVNRLQLSIDSATPEELQNKQLQLIT